MGRDTHVFLSTIPYKQKSSASEDALLQLVERPKSVLSGCKITGGARGGEARLELDQMPRKALRGKACRERSEDFRAALQNENLALFQTVKKSVRTFLTV